MSRASSAKPISKKVLFVLTSHEDLGNTGYCLCFEIVDKLIKIFLNIQKIQVIKRASGSRSLPRPSMN